MFSFKSRAWQLGLTGCLLILTYLVGLTQTVSDLEYDLFQYIVNLKPNQAADEVLAVTRVPDLLMLMIYAVIFAIYVRKYTRSRTTAVSFLTLTIILFFLLMVEILLALFYRVFLPIILPVVLMLLVSGAYWLADIYQRFVAMTLLIENRFSLADVHTKIEDGNLKSALIILKQCPISDDLLELGYELGMLLESRKQWASALNLYHWLSQYDPGLGDFVTRVAEIREKKESASRERAS